jgi:hypothetical protein
MAAIYTVFYSYKNIKAHTASILKWSTQEIYKPNKEGLSEDWRKLLNDK